MDIMWCLCVEVKIQGFVLRICYVSFLNVKVFVKNSYKLPYEEQRITKLDWKSTMYSVVKPSS